MVLEGVNAKVVRLVDLVEAGFAIRAVEPAPDGGLTMRLAQGDDARALEFAFYEVPAILQATKVVGTAG